MRVALDTNRYRDFVAGDTAAEKFLESCEQIFLPFIVLAELRAGFLSGERAAENEVVLGKFLSRKGISVIFADEATVRHFAELQHQLRNRGTPIPVHDIWIAALTIQHHLTLYTRDRHFDRIPQLPRV
jgi:tRNA(fMet)-specific endonuclease VapC